MSAVLAKPDHLHSLLRLEAAILSRPQVDMPVEHSFCEGLYVRTMHIPAGTVATGAVHASEHFLFVRNGDITVATEQGPERLGTGAMLKTMPGAKRAVVTHADTVLSTVHANPGNETDPLRLWNLYTMPVPLEALSQPDRPLEVQA